MAEAFGAKPGREYVSPPGSGSGQREKELIGWCAQRAKAQVRNEYFAGVRFDDAVRFAAGLCEDAEALAARATAIAAVQDERRVQRLNRRAVQLVGADRRFVTFEEAAQIMSTPAYVIHARTVEGELSAFQIGSSKRVPLNELLKIKGDFPAV